MKKLLSLSMVLLLALSTATACNNNQAKPVTNTESTGTTGENKENKESKENKEAASEDIYPFKETFKIKIAEPARAAYGENNLVERTINKDLNVEVEYIKVPEVSYKEQLGIMLASQDLPDIVSFLSLNDVGEWASQGAVIPLNDLIESDAPAIKNIWTEEDWIRSTSSVDGNVYAIPAITDLKEAFSISYRKDWLDKLGLETPVTLEEWKNVLIAVRDGDPNGNGQKDEIPFVGELRAFQNAFGIQSTDWQIVDDKYINRFEHPNYMEYLAYVGELYKEGLIDKEYYTRNKAPADIEAIIFADKAFANENWAAVIRTATDTLREVNPEATFAPTDPIKGPHGDQQIMGRSRWMTAAGITVQAKDPVKTMQFLDWFFTEDGQILTNYGVEGETFDMVDNKPKLKAEYSTFETSRKVGINKTTSPLIMTTDYYTQCLLEGKNIEEAGESFRLFYDGLFRNTAFTYIPAQQIITTSYASKWPTTLQVLTDAEVQTIIGNMDIDSFKKILETEKANSLDAITTEMNDVYSKLK